MIYVGDILASVDYTSKLVAATPDLDSADTATMTTLTEACRQLRTRLDAAILALDASIGSNVSGGLAMAVSGAFAPDVALMLLGQAASLEQLRLLVEMRGLVGRISLNVTQAAGGTVTSEVAA